MSKENEEDNLDITISPKEDIKPEFPYLKNIILASSTIKMWPNTKKRNSFLYHLGVWLMILFCISQSLAFLIKIIKDFQKMESITTIADLATVAVSGTFRYIYVYVKSEKYLLLVSQIHNNFIHYPLFQTKNRPSIIRYYNFANKLGLGYAIFTFSWVLQLVSVPALKYAWENYKLSFELNETQTEPIPYPIILKTYAPFDYTTQPGNIIYYIFGGSGCLIFCGIYMAVDSFWYMVILLTTGQFAMLKASINIISEAVRKSESTEGYELLKENQIQKLEEVLKCCVKQHQFTRQIVYLIEELSNPNVLVDSLHILISTAFILVDVVIGLNLGDWNRIMISCQFLVTSFAHFFFFNWLAHELAVKEEELAKAVYDIPWYRCPKQKVTFLLIMRQSLRPKRLTGGKIYKLSLRFFTAMAKTVFSYFTFLLEFS